MNKESIGDVKLAEKLCEYCDYHALCESKLAEHDKSICDLNEKYNSLHVMQSVFNERILIFIESMKNVPVQLAEIKESGLITQNDIKNLKDDFVTANENISNLHSERLKRLEKLEEKVEQIDEEGSLNVRHDITNNYTKIKGIIYVAGTIGAIAIGYIASLLIGLIK